MVIISWLLQYKTEKEKRIKESRPLPILPILAKILDKNSNYKKLHFEN